MCVFCFCFLTEVGSRRKAGVMGSCVSKTKQATVKRGKEAEERKNEGGLDRVAYPARPSPPWFFLSTVRYFTPLTL